MLGVLGSAGSRSFRPATWTDECGKSHHGSKGHQQEWTLCMVVDGLVDDTEDSHNEERNVTCEGPPLRLHLQTMPQLVRGVRGSILGRRKCQDLQSTPSRQGSRFLQRSL